LLASGLIQQFAHTFNFLIESVIFKKTNKVAKIKKVCFNMSNKKFFASAPNLLFLQFRLAALENRKLRVFAKRWAACKKWIRIASNVMIY